MSSTGSRLNLIVTGGAGFIGSNLTLALQERFPEAEYEDVTGLCKLARQPDVKEQEYSLNPGRYVGVVIEEDGKTEEEFISELFKQEEDLTELTRQANAIASVVRKNVLALAGD